MNLQDLNFPILESEFPNGAMYFKVFSVLLIVESTAVALVSVQMKLMNSFNTPIAIVVHPTESTLTSGATATSPSTSNYLGGAMIFLFLVSLLRVSIRAASLKKSRKAKQIEMLKRIWEMKSQRQTRS